jgi:ferrous iron transport protein B
MRSAKHKESLKSSHDLKRIVLVGTPNVGKSVIFNFLTGAYVTVSNYPGTTVEISRGKTFIKEKETWEVIDTPGMYSLLPITEEERVSRTLLLEDNPDVVLHIIDAKNLERMLNLTIQLVEAGLPVIVVINMIDEADKLGIKVNPAILESLIGIPVVATSATSGYGLDMLKKTIRDYYRNNIRGKQAYEYGSCGV